MSTTNTTDRFINLGSSNGVVTVVSFTTSGDIKPSMLAIQANDGGAGGIVRFGRVPNGGPAESFNATFNSAIPCTGIAIPIHSKSGLDALFFYPNGGATNSIYVTISRIEGK